MKIRIISLTFLVVLTPLAAFAELVTFDSYMEQVTKGNQNYSAVTKGAEAGKLKSEEGELITSTSFFTNLQYTNDKRVPMIPAIMGDRTSTASGSMGFAKNTTFGLSGKLYYALTQTSISGVNQSFIPYTEYYESSPVLELRQSLWQNSFGRQTRATRDALEAKAMSDSYSSKFSSKQIMSASETLYWTLSTTRELVKVQKENLKRAERLRDWSKRRVSNNLADRVDLLQAESMLKMRQLELEGTQDTEKDLIRQFNTNRGASTDDIEIELEIMNPEQAVALNAPERKGVREDVKALEAGAKAAAANARISRDKNAPTLDLFGKFSLNGKDEFDPAFKDSFSGRHPYTIVGLSFSTPLSFGIVGRVNSGYDAEKISAEYAYQRKVFETDRQWNDLSKKLDDIKQKLKLAYELEKLQEQKLSYEEKRLKLGRTTTYQVITFEDDLANAQQKRLMTQQELIATISAMKTFVSQEEI